LGDRRHKLLGLLYDPLRHGATPMRGKGFSMTQKSNVVFISRQRVVGATNGSSAYLLDLAQAVRDAGLVPHLIQPSPSIIGRTPIIKMRPEMDVFASHQVRGLLRIGRRYVSLSPRVYAALARAALAAIARRIGILAPWTADRPLPYSVSIPWTAADHGWLRGACRGKADVAIADYMFCAEGFQDLPSAAVPTAIVMHDLFHARAGEGQDSVALVDRDHEISMLTKADAVIAIQVTEESFIKDHVRSLPPWPQIPWKWLSQAKMDGCYSLAATPRQTRSGCNGSSIWYGRWCAQSGPVLCLILPEV